MQQGIWDNLTNKEKSGDRKIWFLQKVDENSIEGVRKKRCLKENGDRKDAQNQNELPEFFLYTMRNKGFQNLTHRSHTEGECKRRQ